MNTQTNAVRAQANAFHELRARANAVRAVFVSNLPQPPVVDPSLTGRERDIALEADSHFELALKGVFFTISVMSKNMIVRDDIKAEMANALQPVVDRLVGQDSMHAIGGGVSCACYAVCKRQVTNKNR